MSVIQRVMEKNLPYILKTNLRARILLFIAVFMFVFYVVYFVVSHANASAVTGFVLRESQIDDSTVVSRDNDRFYIVTGIFLVVSFLVNVALFIEIRRLITSILHSNEEILEDIDSLDKAKLDQLKESVANRDILLTKLDRIRNGRKK